MAYETLILTREERFAIVTLNRPPANAISETLMRELNAALSELESDDAVRAVIITGAGDKIFCAGADLGSAFQGSDVGTFIRFGNSVVRRIERFPKPVVAAINGHALGGGCEIAMGCHIRILKEGARMGQTESNLGIIPGFGGTQRYPRLARQSAVEGGRDAQRRTRARPRAGQAPADRHAPHHRGGGRRHPRPHRPGHRGRGAGLPPVAPHRGRG
jgi:enoyl-CoA hydratase/carnithine racemase